MKKLSVLITILLAINVFALDNGFRSSELSFETDIRPVFKTACTKCHNGSNKLPNIIKYEVAYSLRSEIVQRISKDRTMPMYGELSESNRDLIKAWVNQGAKK